LKYVTPALNMSVDGKGTSFRDNTGLPEKRVITALV